MIENTDYDLVKMLADVFRESLQFFIDKTNRIPKPAELALALVSVFESFEQEMRQRRQHRH